MGVLPMIAVMSGEIRGMERPPGMGAKFFLLRLDCWKIGMWVRLDPVRN
jgi:hypothetical protein